MSAALLPPDPTREASYWMKPPEGQEIFARWDPVSRWTVEDQLPLGHPDDLAWAGYTLASRHPIPTAAQLDALWELAARVVAVPDRPDTFESGYTRGILFVIGKLRAALKGDAP